MSAVETRFEPMGIGGILDRSFALYRQNFVRFLAIVAIVNIPVYLVGVVLQQMFLSGIFAAAQRGEQPDIVGRMGPLLVQMVIMVLGNALAGGALVRGISQAYLGQETSVGEAYAKVLPKLLTLIGAGLLVGLVVGLGLILLIIPGIIFALMYALTTQVVVVEDTGAMAAMGRSKQLTSGNLGKVFLLGLAVGIIGAIFGWVFGFAARMITPQPNPETVTSLAAFFAAARKALLMQQIFEAIASVLLAPFAAGAYILLYYDLRIRKEGFDLEMLAQTMGATLPADETNSAVGRQ